MERLQQLRDPFLDQLKPLNARRGCAAARQRGDQRQVGLDDRSECSAIAVLRSLEEVAVEFAINAAVAQRVEASRVDAPGERLEGAAFMGLEQAVGVHWSGSGSDGAARRGFPVFARFATVRVPLDLKWHHRRQGSCGSGCARRAAAGSG